MPSCAKHKSSHEHLLTLVSRVSQVAVSNKYVSFFCKHTYKTLPTNKLYKTLFRWIQMCQLSNYFCLGVPTRACSFSTTCHSAVGHTGRLAKEHRRETTEGSHCRARFGRASRLHGGSAAWYQCWSCGTEQRACRASSGRLQTGSDPGCPPWGPAGHGLGPWPDQTDPVLSLPPVSTCPLDCCPAPQTQEHVLSHLQLSTFLSCQKG